MLIKLSKCRIPVIAIITIIISGCASDPVDPQQEIKNNMQVMRSAVIDNVKDEERQKKLIILNQSLETTLAEYNRAYSSFASEFGKLNRTYDTPREKLEKLLESFRRTRKDAMTEVMDIHFKMVAQTSADEWSHIVKQELKAIESVRESRLLLQGGQ